MSRRRAAAAAVLAVLAGLVALAACSFPDFALVPPDGAAPDATVADAPADAPPNSDGGSLTIDASGPCNGDQKRCGIACTSIYDPNHGCGVPSCDPCAGQAHSDTACVGADASCKSVCQTTWADCDQDAANGCEVDVSSGDGQNCGGCRKTCDAGVCMVGGACGASCGDAGIPCGAGCADTTRDPKNCGACALSEQGVLGRQ